MGLVGKYSKYVPKYSKYVTRCSLPRRPHHRYRSPPGNIAPLQEESDPALPPLVAERQELISWLSIHSSPSSSTSKEPPANELIVDSPPNFNTPVDTPPPVEDEGGI